MSDQDSKVTRFTPRFCLIEKNWSYFSSKRNSIIKGKEKNMNRIRPTDGREKIGIKPANLTLCVSLLALSLVTITRHTAYAEQPPPPCHPNPNAAQDVATVTGRDDVANLPGPLRSRIASLNWRTDRIAFCPYRFMLKPMAPANCSSIICWIQRGLNRTFSRHLSPVSMIPHN